MSLQEVEMMDIGMDLDEGEAQAASGESGRNYLIFLIDDLKLGVDAECVVEILTNQMVTYLPMLPPEIEGVFNMRGQIIPVMDMRMRLGKPPLEGDKLMVVLNYANAQLGLFVDGVDEMIEIPNSALHPVPAQSTQILVSEMCTIPDGSGTMLVLDCDQLFNHD